MKRVLVVLAAVVCSVMIFCSAEAATVTGFATADNHFWGWTGSSWSFIGNINPDTSSVYDWRSVQSFNLTGTPYLYFAVANSYNQYGSNSAPNNPAGFIAALTSTDGAFVSTGTNRLVTNAANWDIVAYSNGWGSAPAMDPTLLGGWTTPTSYGYNGVSPWGTISSVGSDAQWLWTSRNSGDYYNMDNYVVLRTNASAVPEPATMLLLGMGLLGAAGLKRFKK